MSTSQTRVGIFNHKPSDYAPFLHKCDERQLKVLQDAFLAGDDLASHLDPQLLANISSARYDRGVRRFPSRAEINAFLSTAFCWSLAAPDILQFGRPRLPPTARAVAPETTRVHDSSLTATEPFDNVLQGECCILDGWMKNWRGSPEYQETIKAALTDPPKELTCNKLGVLIIGHADFGLKRVGLRSNDTSFAYGKPAPRYYRTLNIFNGGLKPVVLLDICGVPSIAETFTLHDDHGLARHYNGNTKHSGHDVLTGVVLQRGAHYQVTVELTCTHQDVAWHQQWLLFMFAYETHVEKKDAFVIGRRVSALVGQIIEEVKSCLSTEARPFYPAALRGLFDRLPHTSDMAPSCLNGARGSRMQTPACCHTHLLSVWPIHLLDFEEGLLVGAMQSVPGGSQPCPCIVRQLRQLSRLLALEETAMERDIKDYDMFSVKLHHIQSNTFSLEVPGLPENRPSVMPQDVLYIRLERNAHVECTADVVALHLLPKPRLILELPLSFTSKYPDLSVHLVHVRFTFDRLFLTRMHKALAMVARSTTTLLPCICKEGLATGEVVAENNLMCSPIIPSKSSHNQNLLLPDNLYESKENSNFSRKINESLNYEQWESVKSIVHRSHGSGPYIILGPPGTGKTMTVVECILQLVLGKKKNRDARILVCAPSNYAADILCSGIAAGGVGPSEMWRMNDPRRALAAIKVDVLPFCKVKLMSSKGGSKLRFKVIVCTCGASGMLNEDPLLGTLEELTHIFIDEAGQALIPEAFIPFSLGTANTSYILCGDPKQLGPVVHSKYAVENSFDESLIGRYQRVASADHENGADTWAVSKLIRNYRASSMLLELPSKLFYNNELIAAAPASITAPPRDWTELNDRGFPLLFFGVKGQQMREGESPSYFNPVEAGKVLDLIKGLISKTRISSGDIGVMAPYRRQVQKLRLLLRSCGLGSVRVGTVDDYQGQEEQVVFISTVLTRLESLKLVKASGKNGQIGFLSNAKRFNVAITRAKAMLVVVGHPLLLASDENWSELLRYCLAKDAFRGYGSQFVIPSHDPEFSTDLENMAMTEDNDVEDAESTNERALEETITKIAEFALLGQGDTDKMYPVGLDSYYSAMSEETEWRIQI